MAWAHVQSAANNVDTAATSIGVANGTVTAGNLIVVCFTWGLGTGNPTGVTDTVGSSYTQIGTTLNDSVNGQSIGFYYAYAAASGANTVTASFASGAFRRISTSEYSGVTGAPVSSNQRGNFSATTGADNATTSPNSVTPTAAGQLVVAAICETNSNQDYTPGTGFTERVEDASTTGAPTEIEDRSAPSTSALNATWTLSVASTLHTQAYVAVFAESGGVVADAPRIDLGSPAYLNGPDAPPGFFESLLLPVVGPVAAPTSLDLDASGGTATAFGSDGVLSFSYTAGAGAATAGGSNVVFSEGLTAASGAATAGGGSVTLAATWAVTSGGATAGGGSDTLAFSFSASSGGATAGGSAYTLTFVYGASGGGATAGGGSVTETTGTTVSISGGSASADGGADTLSFTYSAAAGGATAGGGTDALAFTFTSASGAATAGGGSDALTFVFGVAGGGATAGGGSVTESATTGADVSATGGTATAGGGSVTFAVTLAASSGAASASGGTVSVSIDVTPPPVVEPPVVSGPTGGADYGDETAIYGLSARVVSARGHGYGWGSSARVRVSSAPAPLRVRVRLPSFRRESARVESRRGFGSGHGSPARLTATARAVSARGAADGWGSAGRVLSMDGDPEAEDMLALTLLGML